MVEYYYKYRHFESPFHLSFLEKEEIYFTPPTEFNDPFDCQCSVPYFYQSDAIVRRILTRAARDEGIPESNIETFIEKRLQTWPQTKRDKRNHSNGLARASAARFGVFSLSLDPLSILMWSHYSNNHSGFCVGLNGRLLLSALEECEGKYPCEMLYGKDPVVDPSDVGPGWERKWDELLRTKAECWQYENEHRLVGNAHDKMLLKPGTIDHVILGINIEHQNILKIIEILKSKQNKPKLYEAFAAIGEFRIELEEISY